MQVRLVAFAAREQCRCDNIQRVAGFDGPFVSSYVGSGDVIRRKAHLGFERELSSERKYQIGL